MGVRNNAWRTTVGNQEMWSYFRNEKGNFVFQHRHKLSIIIRRESYMSSVNDLAYMAETRWCSAGMDRWN